MKESEDVEFNTKKLCPVDNNNFVKFMAFLQRCNRINVL